MFKKVIVIVGAILLSGCAPYVQKFPSFNGGLMAPYPHAVASPVALCPIEMKFSLSPGSTEAAEPMFEPSERSLQLFKQQIEKYINADGRFYIENSACNGWAVLIDFSELSDTYINSFRRIPASTSAWHEFVAVADVSLKKGQQTEGFEVKEMSKTDEDSFMWSGHDNVHSVRHKTRFIQQLLNKIEARVL